MRTPDLFVVYRQAIAPAARHTDPPTSHAAAKAAAKRAPIGRILALRFLAQHGPMTDFELAALSGWQQTSIGKRRGDCVALGLAAPLFDEAGERVTRPAPSGSAASVWRITELGLEHLRKWEAAK